MIKLISDLFYFDDRDEIVSVKIYKEEETGQFKISAFNPTSKDFEILPFIGYSSQECIEFFEDKNDCDLTQVIPVNQSVETQDEPDDDEPDEYEPEEDDSTEPTSELVMMDREQLDISKSMFDAGELASILERMVNDSTELTGAEIIHNDDGQMEIEFGSAKAVISILFKR